MKASLFFFPNVSKQNQRSGKVPLYLRICLKGKKTECRLNFDVGESELLKWDSITMRVQERNSAVNHYLNRIEQKFQEFVVMQATNIPDYSPNDIRNAVMGVKQKGCVTIMSFVDKYFEDNVLNNSNRAPGTTKNYRRAINHLKFFLEHHKMMALTIVRVPHLNLS